MKKNYSKPDIFFDNFSLCNSIAAFCARPTNTPVRGTCALMIGGKPLFLSGVSQCYFVVEDGTPEYDGICYHVPTDTTSIFNS